MSVFCMLHISFSKLFSATSSDLIWKFLRLSSMILTAAAAHFPAEDAALSSSAGLPVSLPPSLLTSSNLSLSLVSVPGDASQQAFAATRVWSPTCFCFTIPSLWVSPSPHPLFLSISVLVTGNVESCLAEVLQSVWQTVLMWLHLRWAAEMTTCSTTHSFHVFSPVALDTSF